MSDEHNQVDEARRGGRRLDPTRDAAIMRAALEGLAELGYDRLSMEEIARRAHAGKGALYRRWPSKAALVVDAVRAWREEQALTTIPDTGSLAGDIEATIAALVNVGDAATRQMAVFIGLATAVGRDAKLKAELSEDFLMRRRALGEVLGRAVARGEISADRDLELVPDVLMGLFVLQILLGDAPDSEYVHRMLETIIYPLLIAEPRLEKAAGTESNLEAETPIE